MRLTTGQQRAYEAQLNAKIRRDEIVKGKYPIQSRKKESGVIYGVDIINSTTPPIRSRWIAVETDDEWEQYWEDDFPGQTTGWQQISKARL